MRLMHSEQDRRSGQLSKRQMEVEAEAVAFVVCTANGIDCRDQSRDYIHLYNGDAKLLLQSMNRIQQTAAKILDLMQEPRRAEKQTIAHDRWEHEGSGDCCVEQTMIQLRPGGGDCAFAGLSGSQKRNARRRSDGFTVLPILNGAGANPARCCCEAGEASG